MRLEDHLRVYARRLPQKTALTANGTKLSAAALDAASHRLAGALRDAGVRPGDRVVLFLDNGAEYVAGLFAIWKAGAVACPLHPSTRVAKLGAILENLGAVALLTQARLLPVAHASIAACGLSVSLFAADQQGDSPGEPLFRLETVAACGPPSAPAEVPAGLALILHTSGSTGAPKGVMHTHASLGAACVAICAYLGLTEDDGVFNVLPLSFGYGLTQVLMVMMTGTTLHLEKSFAFPAFALQRLAESRASVFPLVPSIASTIVAMDGPVPGFLPDVRTITSAAAAMPPTVTDKLQRLFPAARLHLMYGQTECIRAVTLPPEATATHPVSVGFAIPGTQAFVLDESGEVAPPGAVGELTVRGPHVMAGYWNDPAASNAKLRDVGGDGVRTLLTGDLFTASADGFLTFVSRSDDIIKSRGEKVSPQEVERALYAIEGVRDAAVAGVSDDFLGEAVKAFVVLAPGSELGRRDILLRLSETLEDYMLPRIVEFCDVLPKTASGKVRVERMPSPKMQGEIDDEL
jgi:acyl-CoA synthetase (AMP-forming)/AMP-acid ligase II